MIKLTDILKEIKTAQKAAIKTAIQTTSSKSMQLFVIEDVLSSGAFNNKEAIALREFFTYRKSTPILNENTVRMITKEMLKEGFLDWIKEKGSQFKDSLSAGWDKLKAAWSNFKEFIQKLVDQLKEKVLDLYEKAKTSILNEFTSPIQSAATAFKEKVNSIQESSVDKLVNDIGIDKETIKNNLPTEIENLLKVKEDVMLKLVSVMSFDKLEADAVAGKGIDAVKVESIGLLKNKRLVETLIAINESSDLIQPEDLVKKYPVLKGIIKFFVNLLKYTFGLLGEITKGIFKLIFKLLFVGINKCAGAIGSVVNKGNYAVHAALFAYSLKIAGAHLPGTGWLEDLISAGAAALSAAVPVLAPFISILTSIASFILLFIKIWAIITVLINIIIPLYKEFSNKIKTDTKSTAKSTTTPSAARQRYLNRKTKPR